MQFSIVTVLNESSYLLDLGWTVVSFVSTSFGTILRILLMQFAGVGMTSRLQFITYFIAQII